ncbi:hypothetical protein J132_08295 [Termitomyces sp. J132]|nr:hypothetical protein J132_08295 [Termitomyces sp. J132]
MDIVCYLDCLEVKEEYRMMKTISECTAQQWCHISETAVPTVSYIINLILLVILETECQACGFEVLLLPKFHCELNFIEQCWGHAKCVYHMYPPSSKEEDLEVNVKMALAAVPLLTMQCYTICSQQFMYTYHCGLDGKQVTWTCKKYQGHHVLPNSLMMELEKENI